MPVAVKPEWSKLFNFDAHSPSGLQRTTCLEIFDKVIARQRNMREPTNSTMLGGTQGHYFVSQVLIDGVDQNEAYRHALSQMQEHTPREYDPSDAEKLDIILNGQYKSDITGNEDTVFALTLQHLLDGTKEAVKGENKVTNGRWISVHMPDVELPFIGEIDIETRGVVELKTQWPYPDAKAKRGFKINSLPAKPKADHVTQCALYWKWLRKQSDNVPVTLVYANCKGYRVFSSVDCPELSEARLEMALESARLIVRTRETLMKKADSIPELLKMIVPDFGFWMWKSKPPAYKQLAEQMWSE